MSVSPCIFHLSLMLNYFTFLELETMKPLFGPRAEGAAPNLRNR